MQHDVNKYTSKLIKKLNIYIYAFHGLILYCHLPYGLSVGRYEDDVYFNVRFCDLLLVTGIA